MTYTLIARHEVKDFNTWKQSFDGGAEFVKSKGVIASRVQRDLDNPNMVTVQHQFADADTIKAFMALVNSDTFRKGEPVTKGGVILETMAVMATQDVE